MRYGLAIVLSLAACRPTQQAVTWSGPPPGVDTQQAESPPTATDAIVQVAVGSTLACARTKSGQLLCWGDDGFDPRSNETCRGSNDHDYPCRRRPTVVADPDGRPLAAIDVAAGSESACAIVGESRRVRCWGYGLHGGLGDGTFEVSRQTRAVLDVDDAVQVAVGAAHACALKGDGSVDCWGHNTFGQLGDGTQVERARPARVIELPAAIAIATGSFHTCAVTQQGEAWCWGDNGHGQLGDGTHELRTIPVRVPDLPPVTAIVGGRQETCAIGQDTEVWCWGAGAVVTGKANDGRPTPARVEGTRGTTSLALAMARAYIVRDDGKLLAWGYQIPGPDGQLADLATPIDVPGHRSVEQIGASWETVCVRTRTGKVACWGANERGQLGDGTTESRSEPRLIVRQ